MPTCSGCVIMCLNEAAWLIMNITAQREDHPGHVLLLNVNSRAIMYHLGTMPVPIITAACVCKQLTQHQLLLGA